MPIHLNYATKKAILTRYKNGSTSVQEHLEKNYPNEWHTIHTDVLNIGSIDDEKIENHIDINSWDVYYVIRNPIEYTLSGYKHFWYTYKTSYFCRNAFNRLLSKKEYDFAAHVQFISDIHLQYEISRWRDAIIFFTHCASMPIRHYRPWMKLVKLENDFDKLHEYVGIDEPFPHSNHNSWFAGDINIDDETERLLRIRWAYTADIWGYDLTESINKYK